MSFVGLMVRNVRDRPARALLTALAIGIAVTSVVTLGAVTHSMRDTARGTLRWARSDFTIAAGRRL